MFGEKLKKLRIDNKMTQQELAKILKISSSTIGMYEQNRRSPDIETLKMIAEYFQCSTDYLLDKDDQLIYKNFSHRMKELRAEKNITLEELSKALNATKSTLSRYENNLRTPNADFINQLAKFFNVSVDYLLGNADVKEPIDIPQKYTDKYKITKKDIEQHDEIIKHAQAFMMDDEVGEDDKEKLVAVINKLYWDSKAKNKEKFGKKKNK